MKEERIKIENGCIHDKKERTEEKNIYLKKKNT